MKVLDPRARRRRGIPVPDPRPAAVIARLFRVPKRFLMEDVARLNDEFAEAARATREAMEELARALAGGEPRR